MSAYLICVKQDTVVLTRRIKGVEDVWVELNVATSVVIWRQYLDTNRELSVSVSVSVSDSDSRVVALATSHCGASRVSLDIWVAKRHTNHINHTNHSCHGNVK